MNIVVFGAGALGSVFGVILSKKNDVILITRGEHLKKIREGGLKVKGYTNGTFYLDALSYYPGNADLIILTVKSYDTERAKKEIKKEYSDEVIITFQNGVGIVEILKDLDVVPGVTTHGATLIAPGIVSHTGYGKTYIGEEDGKITERIKKIGKNFTDCGLKTEVVNNIMEWRWLKAAINSCINPLTAIAGVKNGELIKDENLHNIMKCIADECEKKLKKMGIKENILSLAEEVVRETEENYSSMLQDIMHGKKTEVDYIVKPFIEGKCNFVLYNLIKNLEKSKK